MESEFFQNGGIPPPPPPPPPNQSLSIPTWPYLPSSIEMVDQGLNFESALSSLVSSPAASNSNISNENMVMRELICKLGNIGAEISPHSQHLLATSYCRTNTGSNSTNTSCYSTPLNSPPKLNLQHVLDQYNKDIIPNLTDPGFAERAARFSRFGSRSFNGRTNHRLVLSNVELTYNNNIGMENSNLSRVSSSPSLKAIGSIRNKGCDPSETSREESTVSQLIPNAGEAGFKASSEMNSRKRKAASKGKGKAKAKDPTPNFVKDGETNDNSDTKRSKLNEGNGNVNSPVKSEEESKGNGDDENQNKAKSKPPEPPKDYIHVRARRGQATDSHSLAERVRREKISERMKLLEDLVPGCNKVTGKAQMLDEIINYVQSLQRQVECLSMKLASVNDRLDFNMDTFISKDIFQSNLQLPHPIFPLDSSASAIFGHQPLQNPLVHNNISNGTLTQCSVDQLGTGLCHNPNLQLPQLDSFNPSAPQCSTFCEDDLQTIVQMGFRQIPNREMTSQSQNFHGSNQVSHTKVEL